MSPLVPSPLQAIEAAVQGRAETARLDLDRPEDRDRLRDLVHQEVGRWQDEARRGTRPHPLPDPDGIAERAFRNLAGYGPLEPLLADDDVWEIMVNAPDAIFVRTHSAGTRFHTECFHDDAHVVRTLTRILDDAGTANRTMDPSEGLQDAQLDDGSRLHIVHDDIADGGHHVVNIRKFTGVPFRSLDDLVDREMLTTASAGLLRACARARLSVVFAGPPGSGKTTLLACTAAELDPALRVVVAEEVREVDIPLPNVAAMQTRPARPERPGVDLRRLVSGFLRMAPDVAIVGEVRDREAMPLLLTLSSGITGYTTIHAASARQALTRLRFVAQLSDSADLPLAALNQLVAESVDVVVHSERGPAGPRVTGIVAVEDLTAGPSATQFTVTELFARDASGRLLPTGHVPVRAAAALERTGFDLRALAAVR